MLKISENIKKELRIPFGKVYNKTSFVKKVIGKKIICVGDYVSLLLLKNNIIPDIAVVDFKTERKKISNLQKNILIKSFKHKIFFKNQKGTISKNAVFLASMLKIIPISTLIVVEGEEDLVALPFIANLRKGDLLTYGIMKKGSVLVNYNASEKAKSLLKKIESENKIIP